MLIMVKYCLDTNIVSEIMRKDETVMRHMQLAADNGNPVYIPTVVYYEIVRGLKAAKQFRRLREFLALYASLPHLFFDRENYNVIEKATEIYVQLHKGNQIEDSDVFIAAIALVNDCTLVTANVRHFERVEGLKLANWRID